MVLDFLPYELPKQPRKQLGWIRYITFAASLIFVAALFLAHVGNIERIMFWAFIIGNILYYAVGMPCRPSYDSHIHLPFESDMPCPRL